MKSSLMFLILILLSSTAMAASGRINIQTTPVGAKYLIVSSQDMKLVKEGLSPYFDTKFPTGKYKVCFQLDGYEAVWQDIIVQTSGSAWVGPIMKKSADASQNTCANDLSGMKAFQTSHPVPMAGGSSSYTSTRSESFDQSLVELERERLKSLLESCPPLTEWKKRMACQDRISAKLRLLEKDPEQAIYNSAAESRSNSREAEDRIQEAEDRAQDAENEARREAAARESQMPQFIYTNPGGAVDNQGNHYNPAGENGNLVRGNDGTVMQRQGNWYLDTKTGQMIPAQ